MKYIIQFNKPKKINTLIYYSFEENDQYLEKILKTNYYLYKGKYEINIYTIVFTLLNSGFKKFKQNYFYNFIKFLNPKIAITFNDLNKKFYELKDIDKKIKLISIQNALRFQEHYKNWKKEKADFFFSFSREDTKFISKFIDAKFEEIGSFRNNFFKNTGLEKKSIIFISVYKPNHGKISPGEKKLLKYLEKFCMKYNYELNIFGRQKYDNKTIREYKSVIKSVNCKFINNDIPYYSIYKLYDLFDLFIFERSTAAYETIAAGKKTLVFNFYNEDKKWYQSHNMTDNFPHTDSNPTEGPFWSHECEYNQFESKILNIINMKQENWDKISKPFISKIMEYDYQNIKFKKILNQLVDKKI